MGGKEASPGLYNNANVSQKPNHKIYLCSPERGNHFYQCIYFSNRTSSHKFHPYL